MQTVDLQAIHFSNLSFLLEVPRVSVEPRNQTFTAGNDVQISCSASGYPPPRLVWTHNGMFITASSRYRFPLTQTESIILLYINYTNSDFSAHRINVDLFRHRMTPGGSLLIKNMEKKDGGAYGCLASNQAGTHSATSILTYIGERTRSQTLEANTAFTNIFYASRTLHCR